MLNPWTSSGIQHFFGFVYFYEFRAIIDQFLMGAIGLILIDPSRLDRSTQLFNWNLNLKFFILLQFWNNFIKSTMILAQKSNSLTRFEFRVQLPRIHVFKFPFLHLGGCLHFRFRHMLLFRQAHALLHRIYLAIGADKIIFYYDGSSLNLLTWSSICLRIFLKFKLDIFISDLDLRIWSMIESWYSNFAVSARADLI